MFNICKNITTSVLRTSTLPIQSNYFHYSQLFTNFTQNRSYSRKTTKEPKYKKRKSKQKKKNKNKKSDLPQEETNENTSASTNKKKKKGERCTLCDAISSCKPFGVVEDCVEPNLTTDCPTAKCPGGDLENKGTKNLQIIVGNLLLWGVITGAYLSFINPPDLAMVEEKNENEKKN